MHSLIAAIIIVFISVLLMHLYPDSIIILIAGIFLLDLGVQAVQVTNISRIYNLDKASNSRINTIYMTCYFIGGAAGTAIGLFCWNKGHWQLATWQMMAFVVVAFVMLMISLKKKR